METSADKPAQAPEISVVIVNYDSGEHLGRCLSALKEASVGARSEVVVIDNASNDRSLDCVAENHPDVSLIRNRKNQGYGRACNRAVKATTAPMICFLNPDTIPAPGSLALLIKKLTVRPSSGAIGPRVINPDGTLYPSCRSVPSVPVALGHAALGLIWPNNHYSRQYKMLDWDHRSERQVDWVSGAAMVVRREAFLQVGGFDEGYFMYVEDVDLCDRMRAAGWSSIYEPAAEMIHYVGGSSQRTPYRTIRHHHLSLMRYACKRSRTTARLLALPFILVGIVVRMLLACTTRLLGRT